MRPADLEAQLESLHPESFGWALHCCGRDQMEAEDVLQTAYVKVLSGKARYEARSSFRTWLFGVIRRTAQETVRRRRARSHRHLRIVPENIADKAGEEPQARMERSERTQGLVRAMEGLSERQKEVLHLVFYQELTIEEAARVMGVSLGSARTHYKRGKERLRRLLREGFDGSSATGS